jgi:hypothetical protein
MTSSRVHGEDGSRQIATVRLAASVLARAKHRAARTMNAGRSAEGEGDVLSR